MPKGKKFDAAEKHFEKERLRLNRENNSLRKLLSELIKKNRDLSERVDSLEDENRRLNDWVERLLEFTEMSKEDIKKVVEHEKSTGGLIDILKSITFSVVLVPADKFDL
jgi:hypothetical protein